jgi:hypothetical protein
VVQTAFPGSNTTSASVLSFSLRSTKSASTIRHRNSHADCRDQLEMPVRVRKGRDT